MKVGRLEIGVMEYRSEPPLRDLCLYTQISVTPTPFLMHPKFFYGYVILALCFANMVVMRGVNGAFGVYYLALLEEFSWSRSDGATIASANFFVYAIASPLVGLAFDRYGPRVLMPLGAFLTGARPGALLLRPFPRRPVFFLRHRHRARPRRARVSSATTR